MRTQILLLTITLMFLSCIKKPKTPKSSELNTTELKAQQVKTTIKDSITLTKYCIVEKVSKKDGKYFIIADYVDLLTGEKAIEKAKQNGDADYDIDKKGDTIYFVYNDYYISNVNPKLRTLELSNDIKIQLWDYPKSNGLFNEVSIAEFENKLADKRIMILKLNNGKVTEMKEQFLP